MANSQIVIPSRIIQTLNRNELVELVSTQETLDAGESWESDFLDVRLYQYLRGGVNSDVVGTLEVQFSPDGVFMLYKHQMVYVEGADGRGFKVPVNVPFAKIKYINGGDAQTVFVCYVYVGA